MSEASLFWKGKTFTKSNLTTLLCSYCENHRHWSTKRCLVCRQYALQQSRVPRRCRQRDRFLWEEEKEVQSVRRHGQLFEWKDTFVWLQIWIKCQFVCFEEQCWHQVTLPEGRGGPVATLRHHYRGGKSSVGIFLHAGATSYHLHPPLLGAISTFWGTL